MIAQQATRYLHYEFIQQQKTGLRLNRNNFERLFDEML